MTKVKMSNRTLRDPSHLTIAIFWGLDANKVPGFQVIAREISMDHHVSKGGALG